LGGVPGGPRSLIQQLQRLTDDDLARVNEILPDGAFGSRYPAAMMPQW
jgi:hypothetical protein